ncbi:hypothetical protein [Umezakia ovalisporum]|jgi:hypothetical protein|uniref:hypothetical protein n=1 Tax=Umezakia ovalisporum TaxID=75695 RepID=UPI0024746EFD|nr:hypothetical protein [Umezakia ovalisporum]MDH6087105.1 hypothetical protein [Umezakia ovalisporum Ak1311]
MKYRQQKNPYLLRLGIELYFHNPITAIFHQLNFTPSPQYLYKQAETVIGYHNES